MFFDGTGNPTDGAVGYFLAHSSTPTDFGIGQNFSIDFYIYDMGCGGRARTTGARTPCDNVWMGTTALDSQGWEIGSEWNQSSLYLNFLRPVNLGGVFPAAQFYIPQSQWVHVTITVDRTGPVEVYLDGVGVASFSAPSDTISLTTLRPLVIGGTYTSGTSAMPSPLADARGYLDEIEIFHRVLTPSEVMDIALPTKGKCKPLPATAKGMTWERRAINATNGTVTVGCVGGASICNPYQGDQLCSASLPVLCFKPSGFPLPASVISSTYNRWSGGIVGTTAAVAASTFGGSLANANTKCVQEFGAGWRVAEFHDGWGWNFQAYGNVGTSANRFWVHINDQPNARCWN
jgi:hypothetical protein